MHNKLYWETHRIPFSTYITQNPRILD